MYVVAIGEPFGGMTFTGPFLDYEDAQKYGEEFSSPYFGYYVIQLQEVRVLRPLRQLRH